MTIAQQLSGLTLAKKESAYLKELVLQHVAAGHQAPGLAVILVGEHPASEIYVAKKELACKNIGILSYKHSLPVDISQEAIVALIHQLNQDPSIQGILVQLPLPKHIDDKSIIDAISPKKDVDGFHPYNLGRLAQRDPTLRPCTPYGVISLLNHAKIPIKGQHAVVIGASNIVGRPMSLELLLAGATVTICHKFTKDLSHYVRDADIVVSAVGIPHLIKGEWIKSGATIIDVGISRLPDGSLQGDVEFKEAEKRAAWITPVPGGVGPMTVVKLMENTLHAAGIKI